MREIRQLEKRIEGNVLHFVQDKLRVEQKKREAGHGKSFITYKEYCPW
jgi:hypothetical protein